MGEREIAKAKQAFSSAEDMHMAKCYEEATAWYLRSIALSLIAIAHALPPAPQQEGRDG